MASAGSMSFIDGLRYGSAVGFTAMAPQEDALMNGWLLWGLILPALLIWAGVVTWQRNRRR